MFSVLKVFQRVPCFWTRDRFQLYHGEVHDRDITGKHQEREDCWLVRRHRSWVQHLVWCPGEYCGRLAQIHFTLFETGILQKSWKNNFHSNYWNTIFSINKQGRHLPSPSQLPLRSWTPPRAEPKSLTWPSSTLTKPLSTRTFSLNRSCTPANSLPWILQPVSSNIAFAFVCASIYIMQFNVSLQYLFDNRLYLMDGSQNLFNDQQKI